MPGGGVYKSYLIGFFVFFFSFIISAVAASLFCPVSDSNAQVVSVENRATGYFVTVTAPDSATIEVTPTPSGTTSTSPASSVNVVTNAPGGYKLYISASNVNLTSPDPNVSPVFTPTESTSLSSNSWGYSLDNSTWNAASTTEANIASVNTANYPNGTNTTIYYGINANTNMPAATYSTTVTYTVVAEGIPEQYTMQGFTIAQCNNMADDENIVLMDTRDGKNYRVTKLKDGNCWMTENLRLDGGRTLTPADSNVTENRTLPENIADGTPSEYDVAQIYSGVANNTDSYGSKYGNMYNWNAATATTGKQATTGIVYESVCPKNWILPNPSGSHSYPNLFSSYGMPSSDTTDSNLVRQSQESPFFFPLTGVYADEFLANGAGDYYSRSTRTHNSVAAGFEINNNNNMFRPDVNLTKLYGRSVRCVFQGEMIQNNMYMQDITAEMCQNLAESTASVDNRRTVIDGRDGKSYKISHLADGNCWMVQNLALDGGRTLQPTDSNVTENRVLPSNLDAAAAGSNDVAQITSALADTLDGAGNIYGNHYNFVALTATVGTTTIKDGTITESVCPKNWIVPNSEGDKSYYDLFVNKYGIEDVRVEPASAAGSVNSKKTQLAPTYISFAGVYKFNTGFDHRDQVGNYATRIARYLYSYYYSGAFGPASFTNNTGYFYVADDFLRGREVGYSVRCVLGN